MFTRLIIILLLSGLTLSCKPSPPKKSAPPPSASPTQEKSPQSHWKVPSQIPTGANGDTIRLGQILISQTPNHLGPFAPDPAKRKAQSVLSCSSCHLQGGTQQDAMGFVGIAHRYPAYAAIEGREITLAERINRCFQRSLNGPALKPESPELKAMVAYMQWLSSQIPPDIQPDGMGLPEVKYPNRPANLDHGKTQYNYHCAACHGPEGEGQLLNKAKPELGYAFPPVAGPQSYTLGSAMSRLSISTRYIWANMPLNRAVLSEGDAYDIAAYMNSLSHPDFPGLEKDYPQAAEKPFDIPYGRQRQLGPLPNS